MQDECQTQQVLRSFVDDINQTLYGKNADILKKRAIEAIKQLYDLLTQDLHVVS